MYDTITQQNYIFFAHSAFQCLKYNTYYIKYKYPIYKIILHFYYFIKISIKNIPQSSLGYYLQDKKYTQMKSIIIEKVQ